MTMTVKSEYGRALFLLAKESGATEKIKSDLTAAVKAMEMMPEYTKLLDTPAIEKEEKIRLCDEAFRGLDEYVVNVIKMLAEKHSAKMLPSVLKAYVSLYNEDMGIEEVEAVTASPMKKSQLDAMKAKLEQMTGKTVIIKNTVDASILGGVKLRYEGKQIDASVKTRLDGFAEALKNIVIN